MKKVKYNFKIANEIKLIIIISMIFLLIINYFNLDFYFANLIYQPTNSWFYQEHWITNTLIHQFGKDTLILLYLFLLFQFYFRDKSKEDTFERYGKIVLLSSILIGTLMVSILKNSLSVDCPWDLIQFGGDKPYFSLLNYNPSYLPSSHCFPSGHASTAFTWISLYFYASIYHTTKRLKILGLILLIGFGFGLSQQFRGAHFISHDLWSLLVCIFINIIIYSIAFRNIK